MVKRGLGQCARFIEEAIKSAYDAARDKTLKDYLVVIAIGAITITIVVAAANPTVAKALVDRILASAKVKAYRIMGVAREIVLIGVSVLDSIKSLLATVWDLISASTQYVYTAGATTPTAEIAKSIATVVLAAQAVAVVETFSTNTAVVRGRVNGAEQVVNVVYNDNAAGDDNAAGGDAAGNITKEGWVLLELDLQIQ